MNTHVRIAKVNTFDENAAVRRIVEARSGPCPEDPKECWVWRGSLKRGGPSVRFGQAGPNFHIRRALWHLEHGEPVPNGCHLVATCNAERCVRVSHLAVRSLSLVRQEIGAALHAEAVEARERQEAIIAEALGVVQPGCCELCGAPCDGVECESATGCAARASARLLRARHAWEWRDSTVMARPYAVGFTS